MTTFDQFRKNINYQMVIDLKFYDRDFYRAWQGGSKRSAREIVPIVLELIHPKSVVDVGCGVGAWLSVFAENGVQTIFGVDGTWVDKRELQIPKDCFMSHDLTQPLYLDREFELVVSLEVAEHIPSESAEVFVDSLIRLAPVVLFSAAIPLQKGAHHINEQWPNYWEKLFRNRGYLVGDLIRKRIWQNNQVETWYAQNILIFFDLKYLANHIELKQAIESTAFAQLTLVHPKLYLARADPRNLSLREILPAMPIVLKRMTEEKLRILLRKIARK